MDCRECGSVLIEGEAKSAVCMGCADFLPAHEIRDSELFSEIKDLIYDVTGEYPDDGNGLIQKAQALLGLGYPMDAIGELFEFYELLRTAMAALLQANITEISATKKTFDAVDHYRFEYDEDPVTRTRTVRLVPNGDND